MSAETCVVEKLGFRLQGRQKLAHPFQTAVEFPEARSGAATHAMRTRVSSVRQGRQSGGSSAPSEATTADQLKQLADLRDGGAITPDEYQSAKTQLLGNRDAGNQTPV